MFLPVTGKIGVFNQEGSTFGLDTMSNSSYFWKMIKIWEGDPPNPNDKTKSTPVLLEKSVIVVELLSED